MKAVVIKGLELPEEGGFVDVRINSDGTVLLPCAMGECNTLEAKEIDIVADVPGSIHYEY